MAKLNNASLKVNTPEVFTVNNEGSKAYAMNHKEKLMTQVLTTFFNEGKFYGDNSNDLVLTTRKIIDYDPKFVANLACYARNEMYLRTVSQVLTAELANKNNGKKYVKALSPLVMKRPDDMTETLSYYINKFGKPIPNSLKKGISDTFVKFDEYQLAKYNRKRNYSCKTCKTKVTMVHEKDFYFFFCPNCNKQVQEVNVSHPFELKDIALLTGVKAKASKVGKINIIDRLIKGALTPPTTWEVELSTKGNNKKTWEDLIDSKKLPYMAALRNLRNIIKANPCNINKVYEQLSNKENVLRSKQLPFRFLTAYNMLKKEGLGSSKIFDVLETAVKYSCENIKKIPGKTLIAVDVSASMTSCSISAKSEIKCSDIAVMMGAIANYICEDAILVTFDTLLKVSSLPSSNGIISNARNLRCNGGGTDITLPIQYLLGNRIDVDRVIMLSDNEINSSYDCIRRGWWNNTVETSCQELMNKYRKTINPNCWMHAVDLQGYGTQQFKGNKTNLISGWNEKTLEFIQLVEKGEKSLINTIDNYYFLE